MPDPTRPDWENLAELTASFYEKKNRHSLTYAQMVAYNLRMQPEENQRAWIHWYADKMLKIYGTELDTLGLYEGEY